MNEPVRRIPFWSPRVLTIVFAIAGSLFVLGIFFFLDWVRRSELPRASPARGASRRKGDPRGSPNGFLNGSGSRTRTYDPRINSRPEIFFS